MPSKAVLNDGDKSIVIVATEGNVFRARRVEVGPEVDGQVRMLVGAAPRREDRDRGRDLHEARDREPVGPGARQLAVVPSQGAGAGASGDGFELIDAGRASVGDGAQVTAGLAVAAGGAGRGKGGPGESTRSAAGVGATVGR